MPVAINHLSGLHPSSIRGLDATLVTGLVRCFSSDYPPARSIFNWSQ